MMVEASPGTRQRPPPTAVQLLLPVWGRRYIRQFIELGLPTLLAPGNLPAVAKALPTRLVFLTSSQDGEILKQHPACRYLSRICDVDVQVIDDLITGDNYSTTITLAYARAVRAAGADMLQTCFFFLISDYLMADGSLANVLARMQAGADGVLAGNFQVAEREGTTRSLMERFDRGNPELTLPPRELMRWALARLHPMTAANTVNFPLCKSAHSNRLFWRVDESTLIGRFYLMHMIGIRPEVTDFEIGSSCDYSFIPEMCPSGRVEIMNDSDDYLVVEMQPQSHERHFLRLGPIAASDLASGLSEWTTARHRENARTTVVFHAAEKPSTLPKVIAEADAFVQDVSRRLTAKPQPHRDHPYWVGAIAAHRWAVSQRQRQDGDGDEPSAAIATPPPPQRMTFRHLIQHGRDLVFGRPPNVRPWHPRWPDYRIVVGVAQRQLAGLQRRRVLIVSETPGMFSNWLTDVAETTRSMESRRLLTMGSQQYLPLVGNFDLCVFVVGESELSTARSTLERIRPLVANDGRLMIVSFNGRGMSMGSGFSSDIASNSGAFLDLSTAATEAYFVPAGALRWTSMRAMISLFGGTLHRPLVYAPLTAVLGGFLLLGGLIGNLVALRDQSKPPRSGTCSSVCLVLCPSAASVSLPDFAPDRDLYAHATRFQAASQPASTEPLRAELTA